MKIRPFETEALRFFSAGSVPSLPGVPAVQAVRPLHGCFLLPVSQQYPQIPQIISRAPGQDRVTQPRKKRKCIASLKEISRIESRLLRTLERPAVCHRARPGAIAVNPVSPRTQHRHLLSRDFFHARDRKSTRLNSSHLGISYAVFCLKKKKKKEIHTTVYRRT